MADEKIQRFASSMSPFERPLSMRIDPPSAAERLRYLRQARVSGNPAGTDTQPRLQEMGEGLTRAELEGGWPEPSVETFEKWKTIAKMAPASDYGQDGGLRPTAITDLLREYRARFSAILSPGTDGTAQSQREVPTAPLEDG